MAAPRRNRPTDYPIGARKPNVYRIIPPRFSCPARIRLISGYPKDNIASRRIAGMRFFRPNSTQWLLAAFLAASACFAAAAGDDLKSLVQRAFDLHQKGQFSEALPLLRHAYRLDPDDYFVNLLLGIDTLRTGGPKASVPFLQRASRLRPKEEFPLAYLGEAYARQELFGDAAEAYLKAAGVAADSADSAIALVDFSVSRFATMSTTLRSTKKGLAAEYRLRALALAENDTARLSLLQHAADLDPELPGVWSDLARAAFTAGDQGAAKAHVQRALQANPYDLQAWIVDAQLSAESGDWKQAAARLNAVGAHSPHTLAGNTALWPKQLQPPPDAVSGPAAKFFSCLREATTTCDAAARNVAKPGPLLFREQRWEQLTTLPPPTAAQSEVWLQRGIAFAHLDDCRHAIPALERGVAGKTAENYGMFLLSWCYSREAGRTASQVQRAATDDAPFHVMRGDILLRLQAKPEEAVGEYQQALAREPNDPATLDRLAEAQFGAGNNDAARTSAQAALRLDPQRPGAKRTLAKIAMQDRDYTAALPYLRELAAHNPQDVAGRVELAKACAQTGALEDARQNLTPALDHGYPDEKGSLHYLLGTVLKKMGRAAEADRAFAAATELSQAFQQKSYHDQEHESDADAHP